MSRKYTEQEVDYICQVHGIIRKERYIGYDIPMLCICSCDTWINISLNKIIRGQKCKDCGSLKTRQQLQHTQEYITHCFEKEGCILLSEYINNHTKVKYRCSCGNIANITFNDFRNGHRCTICGHAKSGRTNSGLRHPNWKKDRIALQRERKIKAIHRQLLTRYLQTTHTIKLNTTTQTLGYTANELWEYLEHQWHGIPGNWTIDHIFPLTAFLSHGIIDPKIIHALTNLQPLSQIDNSIKKDKYDLIQFQQYCKRHNIILEKAGE